MAYRQKAGDSSGKDRMQRPVEQRHAHKRRTEQRRHPHARMLGFTERQWPFIFVLVGNWLFSAAFFLTAKLVWDWVPT